MPSRCMLCCIVILRKESGFRGKEEEKERDNSVCRRIPKCTYLRTTTVNRVREYPPKNGLQSRVELMRCCRKPLARVVEEKMASSDGVV